VGDRNTPWDKLQRRKLVKTYKWGEAVGVCVAQVDMALQLMAQLSAVQLLAWYLMEGDKWHAITCVPAGSRSHSL